MWTWSAWSYWFSRITLCCQLIIIFEKIFYQLNACLSSFRIKQIFAFFFFGYELQPCGPCWYWASYMLRLVPESILQLLSFKLKNPFHQKRSVCLICSDFFFLNKRKLLNDIVICWIWYITFSRFLSLFKFTCCCVCSTDPHRQLHFQEFSKAEVQWCWNCRFRSFSFIFFFQFQNCASHLLLK